MSNFISRATIPIQETLTFPDNRRDTFQGDQFWAEDISVILDKTRAVEFFPSPDQTLPERLNSFSRLIIYVSIALSIYQGKATAMFFGIFLLIVIYFMWKNQSILDIPTNREKFDIDVDENGLPVVELTENCVMPTQQNPFMNRLAGDDPNRPPACRGSGVAEMAENLLKKQLFEDVDDLFSKNANERMFVTTPSTSRVPDREAFANSLVKGSVIEKNPLPYSDLRHQKSLIPEDFEEEELNIVGFGF